MPRIRTSLCALISLACFISAASGWPTDWLGRSNDEPLIRISTSFTLILVALLSGWLLYRADWHRLIVSTKNVPDPPFQPDERSIAELQGSVNLTSGDIDTKGLLAFIEFLANPARYRVRLSETIDLAERQLVQQVSVEIALPGGALSAKYLYVPVLMPLKGELLDNFRLYDESGKSLANLSYDETTRLAAAGIRYLLVTDETADNSAIAIDEMILLGPVTRRGTINPIEARAPTPCRTRVMPLRQECGLRAAISTQPGCQPMRELAHLLVPQQRGAGRERPAIPGRQGASLTCIRGARHSGRNHSRRVTGLGRVVLMRGLRMKQQPAGRSSAGPYPLSLAGPLLRAGAWSEVPAEVRHRGRGYAPHQTRGGTHPEDSDTAADTLLTTVVDGHQDLPSNGPEVQATAVTDSDWIR